MTAFRTWCLRIFATLGAAGLVAVAVGLLFFAGEIRQLFRGKPAPPGQSIELEDVPAIAEQPTRTIPPDETGGGLVVPDPEPKTLAELERKFDRDYDGDGRIGRVTRRGPAPPTGGPVRSSTRSRRRAARPRRPHRITPPARPRRRARPRRARSCRP